MSFHQFLVILRARWRLSCIVFAAILGTAILLALIMPRKYTAVASVVVDAKSDPVLGAEGTSQEGLGSYINTQVDVVMSQRVAERVVKMVKLDQDKDFRENWRNKTDGKGDIVQWLAQYLLKAKRVVAAPANESATRQTNVIEITVKWPDARVAAEIANAFAQAAIETNIDLKVESAKLYAAFFNQRAAELRADLERKQKRLSGFQTASGIVATDEKLDVENARLTELSTQLVAIQSQRQDSQSRQRQVNGDNQFLPEVLQSPLIATLKDALTVAEARRTEVAGRLGKNHPDYQAAQAEVDSLRGRIAMETSKIVASLGSTTEVNIRRESDIRAALEAQKRRVLELKQGHDEAAVLAGDVASAQRDLDAVTQRLALSNLESVTKQTDVVLLTTASAPVDPSSPNLLILLGVGIFLGGVMGVGSALLMEMRAPLLREEEELVKILSVPVLGRLPFVKPEARRSRKTGQLATT